VVVPPLRPEWRFQNSYAQWWWRSRVPLDIECLIMVQPCLQLQPILTGPRGPASAGGKDGYARIKILKFPPAMVMPVRSRTSKMWFYIRKWWRIKTPVIIVAWNHTIKCDGDRAYTKYQEMGWVSARGTYEIQYTSPPACSIVGIPVVECGCRGVLKYV